MLRTRIAAVVGVALICFGAFLLPLSAQGDEGTTCARNSEWAGSCDISVTAPGSPGGSQGSSDGRSGSGGAAPAGSSGSGSGGSDTCQARSGKPVPCSTDKGSWYAAKECYAKSAAPEASDPLAAPAGSSLYTCSPLLGGVPFEIVLPNGTPGLPPPPPDPAVLAARAVEQMQLRAVRIGIVPEPGANSVGLVGMPTWMWVADPGASTTGPITRSVTERGFTVTATGTLSRIKWSMGDGHSVTCRGAGTPYRDAFGKQSSPTCGYSYRHQGRYTVSATSYWVVEWEGIGQNGEIPLNFVQNVAITVGEAQVIVR